MPKALSWQRWLPLAFFFLATGLYLLTMQRGLAGDGVFFVPFLDQGRLINLHLLHLPATHLLKTLLSVFVEVSSESALKILAAIAGGIGVALTYGAARQILASVPRAVAATLAMMGLVGYWYHSTGTELHSLHTACAALLLLGLVHALDARAEEGLGRGVLLTAAAGALLTPLSHLSGFAMGLPVLYVIWRIQPQLRWRFTLAVGGGFLVFTAIYALCYSLSSEIRAASSVAAWRSNAGWSSLAYSWRLMRDFASQFLLYALPVSALVPAGLRVLLKRAPRQAWLCGLWVVAWPIAVSGHHDVNFGSYHVPTLPVQAILAVVALQGIAATPLRTVLALVLGMLPMVGLLLDSLGLGLGVWVLSASLLYFMSGEVVARPRWLQCLPVATFLLSAPFLLPVLFSDHVRERIRAVDALVGHDDLLVFMPESWRAGIRWMVFFPGAGSGRRAVSPLIVDYLTVEERGDARQLLERLEEQVRRTSRDGHQVWFLGDIDEYEGSSEVRQFLAFLEQWYRFVPVETGPGNLYSLVPVR